MQPANRHLLQWIQRELAGKLTVWLSCGADWQSAFVFTTPRLARPAILGPL
jgi:hypothetical protein